MCYIIIQFIYWIFAVSSSLPRQAVKLYHQLGVKHEPCGLPALRSHGDLARSKNDEHGMTGWW